VIDMQRYFVHDGDTDGSTVRIGGNDYHHIRNVMRMKRGDEVEIALGDGRVLLATLTSFAEQSVLFSVVATLPGTVPLRRIAIAQALLRRERFELMLEKATELGVSRIIPTRFTRAVAKIGPEEEAKKIERFRGIVKEAAEQSHRATVPEIGPVSDLADLPFADYDRVFVCYERAKPQDRLARILKPTDFGSRLLFVIGPEGGIAPEELAFLTDHGAVVCSLGERILRAETASMYLLAAIDALAGES
jgi:16S rRNA (uracil1498-N3)-methyltransferase